MLGLFIYLFYFYSGLLHPQIDVDLYAGPLYTKYSYKYDKQNQNTTVIQQHKVITT